MKQFLYGIGFSFGVGLIYAIYHYPVAGIFVLAGGMFLIGGLVIGGVVLLVNRQWIRAVSNWGPAAPRVSHNIRYPELPSPLYGQNPGREQLGPGPSDPWAGIEVIEAQPDDGRPVA